MFIQVIQGKCSRQDELHALADEWVRDRAPGVQGWLGSTYGFTDDDMFVGVVRFESREAAMANSDTTEQSDWAERLEALCDGPNSWPLALMAELLDTLAELDRVVKRKGFVEEKVKSK